MANASDISIGLMHEVTKTACKAGFETSDFTALAQSGSKLKKILAYLRDEADIVAKAVDKAAEIVIEKTTRLLKEVGKVILSATGEKKTSQSFLGDRYYYRAPELDNCLPEVQSAGKGGTFKVHQLEKEMTFREIAAAILGIDETSDLDLIAKALIENGHTVTLTQIESLIDRTHASEKTELLTNGYGNFFFVQDKNGSVSVVDISRLGDRRWFVYVYRLGSAHRWRIEFRFFSRN